MHAVPFPDHHSYTAGDMRRLADARQSSGGDAFITTEKDAIKLTPTAAGNQLRGLAPLVVARLRASLCESRGGIAEIWRSPRFR